MLTPVRAVRILLAVLGTSMAAGFAAPCQAAPHQEYTLEIPRQRLAQAVTTFGIQTQLNAGYVPDTPSDADVVVGPLYGTFTADAALTLLLEPSGLTYEWIGDDAIRIVAPMARLTAGTAALDRASATAGGSTKQELRWPGDRQRRDEMDSVIVIGTRISSLETESQSVAVLNRQRIESHGASTLAELFEYLPQIPFVKSENLRAGGEQYTDLRGLGGGTTLILINGRRVSGSATSFDTGGFDVNTIPLTAVKRIEVLLDSPSIATGTDAIGGVVNVVLKDEIPQPIMEFRYGGADGGAEERRASFGLGTSHEAFRGALTLDVFQRDDLPGSKRDRTRNQDYRRFGGPDQRAHTASPGNISSLTFANLPGLDSPFAAVPAGSSGVDLLPEDFIATSGQRNLTSLSQFRSIVPQVSRASLVASGELRLSSGLAVFAEILGTDRKSKYWTGPPTLNGAIVPASNPFNPFGVPVAVDAILEGMRSQAVITDTDLIRTVAGVRGEWRRWEGEVSASWSREHAKVRRENELDSLRVTQALASSDRDTALNVFRDAPAGSPALLASLIADPPLQKFSSDSTQGYARAEGPLLRLPAGEVIAMVGGEWRREELSNASLPTSPHRTVSAAFAEIQVPLVDADMRLSAVKELTVSAGMRADDYSGLGSRFTPQYGLVWRPFTGVKMRASYSEAYRAPSLFELYAPRALIPVTLADPLRRNEAASLIASFGGNLELAPSPGHSWTAGIDITPRTLSNLHVSVGYWRTTINDRIELVSLPALLAYEALFPGRVVRAEPSAQDIEAGMAGALRSVDISQGNFGRLQASGVDFNVSYSWDTVIGRFTPNLSATWNEEFRTAIVAGMPPQERVGMASDFGTIPEWRAVASVGWTRGPFTLFSAARFISAYDDAILEVRTGRTIPSQTLLDAQASLQLDALVSPASAFNALKLTAGVTNLLDRGPHYAQVGFDTGYDPSQANLKQRFWYVRLAKEF